MPKLYIISGCNGSGKTTASYTLLPEILNCYQFVNSDEFAKSLSPFDPAAASVSASRYMLLKCRYLLQRRQNFCIETTLATRSLLRTIEEAQSHGYEITLLYFWLNSPDLAVQRVKEGGHSIPEDVIRRRYIMGLKYFFKDYMPASDYWLLADNSKSPFITIAEGSRSGTTIYDPEKYDVIWKQAH